MTEENKQLTKVQSLEQSKDLITLTREKKVLYTVPRKYFVGSTLFPTDDLSVTEFSCDHIDPLSLEYIVSSLNLTHGNYTNISTQTNCNNKVKDINSETLLVLRNFSKYIREGNDKIKRDFLNNAITGKLAYDFPIFSLTDLEKLKNQGITKTDHLIGNFFLLDKDEKNFKDFLIDIGIETETAVFCSSLIFAKFAHL